MILLLKISIIFLVILSLGLMYHIDMNYCVQDFYEPGLNFALCSETFGFRTITTEIVNIGPNNPQTDKTTLYRG